jgi:serine-type D-Ala-D-Ala carboxypeptidase (penicillin-binding protein 5/6)
MNKGKISIFSNIKKHRVLILLYLLFGIFLTFIPYPNIYFKQVPQTQGLEFRIKEEEAPPPPYPVNQFGENAPPVSAEGVVIQDIPSGVILYEKNADVKFPPASTTKIMTAILAMEKFKLEDILTVKTVINEGKTMGLISGEEFTFESLLYGALVHSANDAAFAIAENYPGGVEKFVFEMNEKAKKLKLENTNFANPVGFDDDRQYTTAKDLARQALIGLSDKNFSKIVGTKSITVSDVTYTHFHPLTNVNELLGKIPGISGVKTGQTDNAREVLVSEFRKDGRNLVLVILKSGDRFGDTTKMVNWVFRNFAWLPIEQITPPIRG